MEPSSRGARARRTTLVACVALCGLVLPTLFATLGCSGGSAYADRSGAEIFRRLCAQCHGPKGRALMGVGNSYVGKREFWTRETLSDYLEDPSEYRKKVPHLAGSRKVMPALNSSVPEEARMRLVDHVLGLMDALDPPAK